MFLLKVYDMQWHRVSGIAVLGQGGTRLGRRGSEAWTAPTQVNFNTKTYTAIDLYRKAGPCLRWSGARMLETSCRGK